MTGKKVIVVGGHQMAQRRVPLLAANGAGNYVIACAATPVESRRSASAAGDHPVVGDLRTDLRGAWYAIAATDDPARQRRDRRQARPSARSFVRADIARGGAVTRPPSTTRACRWACWPGGGHRQSAAIAPDPGAFQWGRIAPDDSGAAGAMKGGVAGGQQAGDRNSSPCAAVGCCADVIVADGRPGAELLAELPRPWVIDAARLRPGDGAGRDQRGPRSSGARAGSSSRYG